MNLERFNTILSRAKADMESENISNLVSTLAGHLQQQVNAPAEPAHQIQVSNGRKQLEELLSQSSSNTYPPSWKKVLEEFNLSYFIATELLIALDDAFSGNEITPQLALENVKAISDEIQKDLNVVTSILDGLIYLNIRKDDLEEGQSEISVSIPRAYTDDQPSRLGKEIVTIEKLLNPFAELATGEPQQFKVRLISSSEFLIILEVSASIAAAATVVKVIAEAIRSIIGVYKDVLGVRMMKGTLENMSIDAKSKKPVTAALDEFAKDTVDKGITEAAKQLVKKFNRVEDKSRINEIRNHVVGNMKKIASRIDRGFNFETRMGRISPPEPQEGEDEEAAKEDAETVEMREIFEIIESAHNEQMTLEREGEPILSLPEPESDDDADEKT